MQRITLLFITLSIFCVSNGQDIRAKLDPANDIILKTGFTGLSSFTFRRITTEYVTNENDYFLALTYDTAYVKFERTSDSFTYLVRTFGDEACTKYPAKADTLARLPLEIIGPDGKVDVLKNWKVYRDLFMSGFSAQVRSGLMTPTEFEKAKSKHNDEVFIKRLVMEDINYLFHLYGDTFNTDAEYIRLKAVRSPFSGNDFYFTGSLKLERPPGTRNTVVISTVNKAGPAEKPLLMQEAMEYQRSRMDKGELASEIHAVGLNSEQEFQYNIAQGRMVAVTLSDVVALDNSSRGNIRKFELWDLHP